MLEEVKEKNLKAINVHPKDNSEENIDKYLAQKDRINFYIGYEKEFLKTLRL